MQVKVQVISEMRQEFPWKRAKGGKGVQHVLLCVDCDTETPLLTFFEYVMTREESEEFFGRLKRQDRPARNLTTTTNTRLEFPIARQNDRLKPIKTARAATDGENRVMDTPELLVLRKIEWQLFATLTFKSERLPERVRLSLYFCIVTRILRRIRSQISVSPVVSPAGARRSRR